MNSPIAFPSAAPELKLARSTEKWQAALNEERRRLQEDHDALRERESNLRDYEGRLRAWQAELDAGRAVGGTTARQPGAPVATLQRAASRTPFADDPALQAAWEKLHRAREILEAEQSHLREDRTAVREQQSALKKREDALESREASVAGREALIAAAAVPAPVASEHTISAMTRLTRAPFTIAKSVLNRGRK